jgi:hypothetical protein
VVAVRDDARLDVSTLLENMNLRSAPQSASSAMPDSAEASQGQPPKKKRKRAAHTPIDLTSLLPGKCCSYLACLVPVPGMWMSLRGLYAGWTQRQRTSCAVPRRQRTLTATCALCGDCAAHAVHAHSLSSISDARSKADLVDGCGHTAGSPAAPDGPAAAAASSATSAFRALDHLGALVARGESVSLELIDGTRTRTLAALGHLLHRATSDAANASASLAALLALVPHVLVVLLPLHASSPFKRRNTTNEVRRSGPDVLVHDLVEQVLCPLVRCLAQTRPSPPTAPPSASSGKRKATASKDIPDPRNTLLGLFERTISALDKQTGYAVAVTVAKERLVLAVLQQVEALPANPADKHNDTAAYLCYALRTVLGPALLAPVRGDALGCAVQDRIVRALGGFVRRVIAPSGDNASGLSETEKQMYVGVIERAFLN